jgi:hypothetical protein
MKQLKQQVLGVATGSLRRSMSLVYFSNCAAFASSGTNLAAETTKATAP